MLAMAGVELADAAGPDPDTAGADSDANSVSYASFGDSYTDDGRDSGDEVERTLKRTDSIATAGPLAGMTQGDLQTVAATLCYNRYKPGVPHPLAKHGVWEMFVDPDTQLPYYCNIESGASTWDPPEEWDDGMAYVPPLAKFGAWEVYRDQASLVEYYSNRALGVTTWDVPPALLIQVRTVEMEESRRALEAAKLQAEGMFVWMVLCCVYFLLLCGCLASVFDCCSCPFWIVCTRN